ncbi:hypothetical protein HY310_02610 [Candidatus Microgenomates bacterium]|nr:hypothetical protein [Candidatus Microgenomates bacterium]
MTTHSKLPMSRDNEIVGFCLSRLAINEPCSVIGLGGLGKNTIFSALITDFRAQKTHRLVKNHFTNHEEVEEFLKDITAYEGPQACLVNLSTDCDEIDLFQALSRLRDKRSTNFIFCVFCNLIEAKTALDQNNRAITRSMSILRPVNLDDCRLMVKDLSKNINFSYD